VVVKSGPGGVTCVALPQAANIGMTRIPTARKGVRRCMRGL
jgi:hypothetical protein